MAAPVVQTLDQIMAELAPGAQGQLSNIDKRRGLIATNAEAQKSGLEAAKVKGFNTINNQMTGRGISFGGIAADEQAQYLAEKYLPAVAGVDMSVNEQNLGLDNEAAKIQADMRNNAIQMRENQRKDLNSWNMNERNIAAQAEQARLNREHEARQATAARAAQSAAQAAANQPPTMQQYLQDHFIDLSNSSLSKGEDWAKNQSTEKSGIIGQIASLYNMSHEDAKKYVYDKRRAWYKF